MIARSDLERVKAIAAEHGFRFRHAAGMDMLLYEDTDSAKKAVRLFFSGEKVRPDQATPNPGIDPVKKTILGRTVFVIPVSELLRMKLSAWRDKDRVHVRGMDAAGLITPEVEKALTECLLTRLQYTRETE
jgi:hypothetical protein